MTSFRTQSSLGHGQFGGVHIGKWRTPKWEREVAIKMLDPTTSHQDDKVKFLQEAAIMAQFKHPNVIQLYGIVTDGQPVSFAYIVSVLTCNIPVCLVDACHGISSQQGSPNTPHDIETRVSYTQ